MQQDRASQELSTEVRMVLQAASGGGSSVSRGLGPKEQQRYVYHSRVTCSGIDQRAVAGAIPAIPGSEFTSDPVISFVACRLGLGRSWKLMSSG